MIGRWAKPEEKHDLQVLWSRVFGDGPDVTDLFFRRFPPERHTRVIPAGYGITSMANWLPVTLRAEGKAYSGAYVYAVATAPERRGDDLVHDGIGLVIGEVSLVYDFYNGFLDHGSDLLQ